MNLRTIIVVILSIVCGGAAMWAVNRSIQPQVVVQKAPEVETVDVVVAKLDIPLGTRLTKQMLISKEWPKDYQPRGVVLADNMESIYGQTTRIKIFKGEPIIDVKYGEGRGVSSLLEDGRRAYTIQTPESKNNVAGFVQAGDRVDIHFTDSTYASFTGGLATRLLLQDVQVIGVDKQVNTPGLASKARSVTLSLLPEEVHVLILAQQKGTLSLALRPDGDDELLAAAITYFSDVQHEFEQEFRRRFPPEPEEMDEPVELAQFEEPVDPEPELITVAAPPDDKPVELAHALILRGNSSSVISVNVPVASDD